MLSAIIATLLSASTAAAATELRSRQLTRDLASVLSEHHLEAIAATDPDDAGRVVAALYFPGSQLLVVSARLTAASAWVQQQLETKAYREVYTTVQGSGSREGKVFIQDIGADGLQSAADQPVDVVYRDGVSQTIFNGDPDHKDAAYSRKLMQADADYARLLQLLIDAARREGSTTQ